MEIRHLKHHEVNREKWDACVSGSSNASIYALSWYLDVVAPAWEALVTGDYEAVMPLPVFRKLGIARVIQPLFCQQLSFYSIKNLELGIKNWLEAIPYSYINLCMAESDNDLIGCEIEPRINIELALNSNYESIAVGYNQNTRRNLKRASDAVLELSSNVEITDVITLKKHVAGDRLAPDQLALLENVMTGAKHKDYLQCYGALENGKICAIICLLVFKNRAILIQNFADDAGKKAQAMTLLIDHFIKANSGSEMTLDFEGSMIPGVARFFKGFGGVEKPYYRYYRNNLPFPLKYLIK